MRFEKVDFKQFAEDMSKNVGRKYLNAENSMYAWEHIKMPVRATKYSAGYDICTPIDIVIPSMTKVIVPTGLRAVFNEDELKSWHLQMYVRSSVGIKDGVILTNGTGVIDSDYQFADNGGDMMLALFNTSPNIVKYKAGDRICQAVFVLHGIVENDVVNKNRTGGIGSTNA